MAQVRISYPRISLFLSNFLWMDSGGGRAPFLRRIDKEIKWSLAFHPAFLVFSYFHYLHIYPSLRVFLHDWIPNHSAPARPFLFPFNWLQEGGGLNALVALFSAAVTLVKATGMDSSITDMCFRWDPPPFYYHHLQTHIASGKSHCKDEVIILQIVCLLLKSAHDNQLVAWQKVWHQNHFCRISKQANCK